MRRGDIAAAIRFEVPVEFREHMAMRTAMPASNAMRRVVVAEKFNMAVGASSEATFVRPILAVTTVFRQPTSSERND